MRPFKCSTPLFNPNGGSFIATDEVLERLGLCFQLVDEGGEEQFKSVVKKICMVSTYCMSF